MMNGKLKGIAFFVLLCGFFVLTAPANHSEAEDSYYYAGMAEHGVLNGMFHAHHLLYLPLMRIIFRAAQYAGYAGRAFPVLTGVSLIAGALAVCLFAALLRRAGEKRTAVIPFTCALLFSYGFWRYSTTVEIYAPAAMLSLLTVYCAVRGEKRPFFIGSVLSGSFALLLHLVTIPAVLLAVPVLYVFLRQKARAVSYVLTVLLITGTVYGAVAGFGIRPAVFTDTLVQRGSLVSPLTWLGGLAAWGQAVLSGNFLFSIPAAAGQIVQLFPFQMLQEELYMGQQARPSAVLISPFTFGAALIAAAVIFYAAVRNFRPVWTGRSAVLVPVFIWFAGAAGLAFCFEPANPETWICVLPPFWLLAGLVWNEMPAGRVLRRMPAVLASALLLHNWSGGMSLIESPDSDYCRQKSAWISKEVLPGDLILTADSHSFATFLEYQTPARVMDAKFIDSAQWDELRRQTSGRIFVFDDVVRLLPPVARRTPEAVRAIRETAKQIQPGLQPVHHNEFGTVYQWKLP